MQKPKQVEEVIQDEGGRILGKYSARRNLMLEEIDFVRRFLSNISKQRGETIVSENNPLVNLLKLAGTVKQVTEHSDTAAFVRVDPGTQDSRHIPCTIYQSDELVKKLRTFKAEDYIQIVGFVRSWSKKLENSFENRVEVRITEIKNTGTAKPNGGAKRKVSDDDVPF